MQTIQAPSDTHPRKFESKKDERQLKCLRPLSKLGLADGPTLPSHLGEGEEGKKRGVSMVREWEVQMRCKCYAEEEE